jgi:hypothetical protein
MAKRKEAYILILNYFDACGMAQPDYLHRELDLSRTTVHRILKKMLKEKRIYKWGTTPWVTYTINRNWQEPPLPNFREPPPPPKPSILD